MHAIFAHPESGIRSPRDLAGRAVGVSREAGSFYRVLESLEPHLPAGSIRTDHAGAPLRRLRLLLEGALEAAEFMDLLVPLAELHGMIPVMEEASPRPGVLVARRSLPPHCLEAFVRGWNRGVERINRRPAHYARQAVAEFLEELPSALRVEGADLERLFRFPRFAPIGPYRREEFDRTQEWMLERGLIPARQDYGRVVVESLEP